MRSGFGQAQEQALMRPAQDVMPQPSLVPAAKEIPYDYVAKFTLTGINRGNRVQDVINISVDGAFVAVAIGYSFIPATLADPFTIPVLTGGVTTGQTTLPTILAKTITNLLDRGPGGTKPTADEQATVNRLTSVIDFQCLLRRLCGIDFKYSIVDSGSGRELQNQAIHNLAGLGEATGERPFRPLAKPMLFLPRSTIRIEVEEVSVGPLYTNAELFIVLHGYKMLG
jgi:hypothetical protein